MQLKRLSAITAVALFVGCGNTTTTVTVFPDLSVSCSGDEVVCGSSCTSLRSDAKNCGACGVACKDTEYCAAGACSLFCPQGFKACGQSCINLMNDPANCGACGMACPGGQVCAAGKCAVNCPQGQTVCGGVCSSTLSDPANCGGCGMACGPAEVCAMGKCALMCPKGLTNCGGACVNTGTDAANCGACGRACDVGSACAGGMCTVQCQMGLTLCNGLCTNTASDNGNCGACGNACQMGNVCSMGKCALSCQAGLTNCSGQCVNLQADNRNCGACGAACGNGSSCQSGKCTVGCVAPLVLCNGVCADTRFDTANCGGCGMSCGAPANATPACVGAACRLICNAGFVDCDMQAANGCEVNATTDANNCGFCGNKCNATNGAASCAASQCKVACNANFGDCNALAGDGCEVNLLTDANNCGACKKVCAAGTVCANGACTTPPCQKGATKLASSPNGDVIVCDDPNNVICEQDALTECPAGWRLCTPKMLANRVTGWNYQPPQVAVGEIYCRGAGGASGAGHYTIQVNLQAPPPLNCFYGSSRPTCVTGYGCNEQNVNVMCCAPNPLCGNAKVDSVEEECDDGNQDDTDGCLSSCSWRVPVDHGLVGPSC